uniref:Uncharacterized protein n=1 Tax=Arion vulgaris TaxID=1028688 RepID=A0A0B6ZCM9_9EUPU
MDRPKKASLKKDSGSERAWTVISVTKVVSVFFISKQVKLIHKESACEVNRKLFF